MAPPSASQKVNRGPVNLGKLLRLTSVVLFGTSLPLASGSIGLSGKRSGAQSVLAPVRATRTREPDSPRQAQQGPRTKVAEGEYTVYQRRSGGAVGPFPNDVYNFRESWTLWKTSAGEYEAEGERTFESPRDFSHTNRFDVRLSRELLVKGVTEFAKLRWRPDSGPLTCEFDARELHCSSNAKDPAQLIRLDLPMTAAYGFLWPISPFSLNGITRRAGRELHEVTPVQLVEIVEENTEHPVSPVVLDGQLRYAGRSDFRIAKKKWRADKFELEVPLHPGYVIWTSQEGILLSLEVTSSTENEPSRRMDLVRYEKFADF